MTVLVTGANGFTGSHVVRRLAGRQRAVTALARPGADISRIQDLDVPIVRADLTDPASLRAAMAGVDAVIHTAAYVDLGVVDAARMEAVNVTGTQHLLAAALEAGVRRFVHCSTIGVLGDTGGRIVDETAYGERTAFGSPYDRTKYLAQCLVDDVGAKGLEVVSLLPSGIMGPGDPHFGPVIDRFLAGKLPFWAGGDRITGIVDVEDVAEGLILGLDRGRPGELYLLSAGELTTRQMFAIIGAASGRKPPLETPQPLVRLLATLMDPIGRWFHFNPPLSRERVYYLYERCVRVDAAKARQQLGWRPRSPEDTLRRLLE